MPGSQGAAVENNLFTCSTDTQELLSQKIKELNLNRIVIAACTPRTHEPLFQDTLREAGLNPYLLEMANIRNQNSWVHQKEPEAATAKAKDQLRMAVARWPDYPERGGAGYKALVVGGGVPPRRPWNRLNGAMTVLLEKGPKSAAMPGA
jgi:heterodisulfide reductase subunit A